MQVRIHLPPNLWRRIECTRDAFRELQNHFWPENKAFYCRIQQDDDMCHKGCSERQIQALTLMIRLQVRKQSFIAMADEVIICSMMADIIRWCCWKFDPEAQRTVPLRSQPSQPDQYQMLREEVEQQQERLSTLRLTTQTFTMSLRNLHERIDASELQLNIPQSRLPL